MNRWTTCLILAALAVPSVALADVAPEPCEGADEGDACEQPNGDAGVCVELEDAGLRCEEDSGGGSSDEGCSASSSSASRAAPGLAIVAAAAAALIAAKRRRNG